MKNRREFLTAAGGGMALATLAGCASLGGGASKGKVVVVGAGYGGATAAKYLRLWSEGTIDVTLVERDAAFVSCPLSNLVLGGSRQITDLTIGYGGLARHGVRVLRDEAVGIDPVKRQVRLASGKTLDYDRLILSPGIDFMYDAIPGLKDAAARETVLHAWKAGPQTVALRAQLEAMRDGGVFALHIPKAPYRCPPGPYERACQVASYLKKTKPKSKVLILDANEDVTSKKGLFTAAWKELYGGMIEYQPGSELADVDVKTRTAKLLFGDVRADVLNVVPPQKAGAIAAPFITANNRWCEVDWRSCEAKAAAGVHILGDATLSAPQMPKSGHMANQHGHLCADAVLALLDGRTLNPTPSITNTCYSYVSDARVIHVASVHRFEAEQRTLVPVKGSGGVSASINEPELQAGNAWSRNIWADMLA